MAPAATVHLSDRVQQFFKPYLHPPVGAQTLPNVTFMQPILMFVA